MRYAKMITDLLYPPRCPSCGGLISFGARAPLYEDIPSFGCFVHRDCFRDFRFIAEGFCSRCGTPGPALCSRCASGKRSFNGGRSVFFYTGAAREAFAAIKYHSAKEFCDFFAFAAVKFLGSWVRSRQIDVIVPVPIHRNRKKERGYNQAEELAVRISRCLGIPADTGALFRVKDTSAQKGLTPEERLLNLVDAFDALPLSCSGKRVLLVDDILTTGSTMDLCSWILKTKAGAGEVWLLSLCSAEFRPDSRVSRTFAAPDSCSESGPPS